MPTTTTEHPLPPDDELIDLEPTVGLDPFNPFTVDSLTAVRPGLAMPEGTIASLVGETDALLRRRLLAAAIFLAATFGVLTVWVFLGDQNPERAAEGDVYSLRALLLGLRCLLAATIAGVLASEAALAGKSLRLAEYALFLGLTLVAMVGQYFVNLDLARRGPEFAPAILAFVKDGLIQMLVLMMIYGMLIPNRPSVAARVLLLMFLGPIAVVLLLRLHPEIPAALAEVHKYEEAGSNILFLAIGAALALYGSFLLNGLRTQLHRARKLGQYQLRWKLGEGGMGEVYMAEHQLLKRPCALKLIKTGSGSDPLALARFEREVQSAARLRHPNTIDIYDYGHSDDGTFYYVMEYLEGYSLHDLVGRAGPLPAGRVIYLFRQVCAGLAEAHELGLVHRDLKPANVFVAVQGGESDVVKILDFGLVKLTMTPGAVELTSDLTVSGTPQYMAPEQALADRSLDARADIYALGAVMYFALTGRPPFSGSSPFEIMMSQARDPVAPPSQVHPGVPADLEAVVLRCLEKKPDDRFPNVKALGEALAACESAGDWGPNRADAWWSAELLPTVAEPPTEAKS